MSARDGVGLDHLRDALGDVFALRRVAGELHLSNESGRLRARLHALDAIRSETHDETGWRVAIDLPETEALRLVAAGGAEVLRSLLPDTDLDPI